MQQKQPNRHQATTFNSPKGKTLKITFVKKILADGTPCKKCADVQEKLDSSGQIHKIDAVVTADERDPRSEGMQLAELYNVDRAPFFLVERPQQQTQVYTVYLKFAKEVLEQETAEADELKEIMQSNSDLDFL